MLRFLERNMVRLGWLMVLACLCALILTVQSTMAELPRIAVESRDLALKEYRPAMRNLASLSVQLADERTGIPRTLRNLNVLTVQAARTSNTARLAASEQREYFRQASAETVATLAAARATVGRLDAILTEANRNLNEGALPALTADLQQVRATLESLSADGHTTLLSASEALQQAGRVLADPNIPSITKSLAGASAGLDKFSNNGAEAMGYVRDRLRPTKPSFWGFALGKVATGVAGPLAGAFISNMFTQNVSVKGSVKVEQ